jgi:hypothetical protein
MLSGPQTTMLRFATALNAWLALSPTDAHAHEYWNSGEQVPAWVLRPPAVDPTMFIICGPSRSDATRLAIMWWTSLPMAYPRAYGVAQSGWRLLDVLL